MQNLLTDSNETKSMVPFEFADSEKNPLPYSIDRSSRLHIYQKIQERLSIVNLIDIDVTALLRAILQSF